MVTLRLNTELTFITEANVYSYEITLKIEELMISSLTKNL